MDPDIDIDMDMDMADPEAMEAIELMLIMLISDAVSEASSEGLIEADSVPLATLTVTEPEATVEPQRRL